MASFAGLPHRLQPVATIGPISFVNDSKATNGTAAATALAAFSHIYWVAGGLAKDDGLDAVMPHIGNVEKAGEEFQRLIDYFPGSEYYPKAKEALKQLSIN